MSFWDSIKSLKPISYFSKGRRWVILLFCILLAFILWLLQALNDTYTKRIVIQVEAPTLPFRFALEDTKSIPQELKVDITAKGNELMSYTFEQWLTKKPILKLAIDTLQILPEGGSITIGREELLRQIKNTNDLISQHFGTSNETYFSLYPDYVSLTYAPLIERTLGVYFGSQIDLGKESNSILTSFSMTPEMVTAYGLTSSMDSLKDNQVSTERIPLVVQSNGLSSYRVALTAPSGIKLIPDSVTINIEVAPLKFNSFVTNNIGIRNLASGYAIRLFPSTIKVTYLALDDVKPKDISNLIHPYVDLENIDERTKKLKIELPFMPKELHMIQFEPDAVEYIIERE